MFNFLLAQTLQHLTEKTKPDDCLLGEQPENLDKNRFTNILPGTIYLPTSYCFLSISNICLYMY